MQQHLVAQLARADYLAGRIDVLAWLNSAAYRNAYAQERSDLLSAIA